MTHRRNAFDADVVQISASADTSISSVSTEPHPTHEPTSRRRVSPLNTSSVFSQVPAHGGGSAVTTPLRKQNNPYMYNVLGENASPETQARTSPIPRLPSPPMMPGMMVMSSHHARNLSSEWDDEPQSPNTTIHHVVQPLTAPATPVMGGYLATAYSSAFPPGKFRKADDELSLSSPAFPIQQSAKMHQQTNKKRRGGGRGSSPTAATNSAAALSSSKVSQVHADELPPMREVFTAPTSPSMPSPMTRVYLNGRPIPVPASVAA